MSRKDFTLIEQISVLDKIKTQLHNTKVIKTLKAFFKIFLKIG